MIATINTTDTLHQSFSLKVKLFHTKDLSITKSSSAAASITVQLYMTVSTATEEVLKYQNTFTI
jgi:hypothetical protein